MNQNPRKQPFAKRVWGRVVVLGGASVLTLACFLVLPLIQAITGATTPDLQLSSVDSLALPPPPVPPAVEEPEPPKQEEQQPPELEDAAPPMDLAQLEMALNPGGGGDWGGGDFVMRLDSLVANAGSEGEDFDVSGGEPPRLIFHVNPVLDPKAKQKTPGRVSVMCIVDERGRVVNPMIRTSSDSLLEKPTLAAVRQWRYQPGTRKGKPVSKHTVITVTFPKER